jgi:hypothetical protein
MFLWQQGLRLAARKMPKVVSPRTHAALDYAIAGTFLLMAARQWRSNRRAAVGSLLCGGAAAANAMITDYPGGVFPLIDYKTHGRVDGALAGLTAAAPRLLGFAGDEEAGFFSVQSLAETVVISATDYESYFRRVG